MSAPNTSFDYIIVGGGTAGVVIASRLSQYLPTAKIALLEAGPNEVNNPNVTNPNAFLNLLDDGLLIDYSTTPQPHLNERQIWHPAGRMLSGASGGNVGVWMRASGTDYAVMAQKAGHERFTFKNLLPHFRRIENHWDKEADPKYHGFNGPIHTVGGRNYPLRSVLRESAEALGHTTNPDATKGDPTGLTDLTQCFRATSESSSERQHSAKVYDLGKVDVRCGALVAKILFDGSKRATGVELVSGEKLHADNEVIISCGAQRTPQLLMLSGIGPSEELAKHNIPQLLNAPAVGQNLFDHSSLVQYFKLKNPERGFSLPFNGTMKPEYGQGMPFEYLLLSNIPSSELATVLASDNLPGAHDNSHPHLQDKRCHTMCIPFYFPVLSSRYNPNLNPMDGTHMTFVSLHLLPISRGTVSLTSSDPNDNPIIDPKYLSTETDRYILRRAVRETLRWTDTEPLASHLAGETLPDSSFQALNSKSTDEEIDARIQAQAETIAHPMGTCALGTVLDDEFKVKDIGGLRVCDASVFPEPIGAMPSQTVYALAELCADLVAGGS